MMRRAFLPTLTLALTLAYLLSAGPAATGQAPAGASGSGAGTPPPRVLGTHQIDRYAAIEKVRAELQANPKNLNDWIILGELAQEVATDVPPDLAPGYYKLAHDAYQSALKLAPDNAGLKAAVAFTQQQEQNAERFAQARKRAASAYLEARRRELAAGGTPTVRVYANPSPSPSPSSPATGPAQPYYYYQPYTTNQGQAYTYQQHSQAHSYPEDEGIPAQPRSGQVMTATERAALVKPGAKFAPP